MAFPKSHEIRGGIPINSAPENGQFDNQLPHDGWKISLGPRNSFLGELVGQIPRSGIIALPQQASARDDKEWHMIVHDVSPVVDDHFAAIDLRVGERVVISGRPVPVFLNGMDLWVVEFNTIKAVLRREDHTLWLGSVYGSKALTRRNPEIKA